MIQPQVGVSYRLALRLTTALDRTNYRLTGPHYGKKEILQLVGLTQTTYMNRIFLKNQYLLN